MAAIGREMIKMQISRRLSLCSSPSFCTQYLTGERSGKRTVMEGRTARRPPVNGTSPKTSSVGLALLLLATPGRRSRWFDDMPGASNDSRINKIHPRIRLIFCASRDAPHISPTSVIFVRQYSRKWLMVMVFKANFQIDWTCCQGKNTVRGTRCPWVNSIMSGRSPPLFCTLLLIAI